MIKLAFVHCIGSIGAWLLMVFPAASIPVLVTLGRWLNHCYPACCHLWLRCPITIQSILNCIASLGHFQVPATVPISTVSPALTAAAYCFVKSSLCLMPWSHRPRVVAIHGIGRWADCTCSAVAPPPRLLAVLLPKASVLVTCLMHQAGLCLLHQWLLTNIGNFLTIGIQSVCCQLNTGASASWMSTVLPLITDSSSNLTLSDPLWYSGFHTVNTAAVTRKGNWFNHFMLVKASPTLLALTVVPSVWHRLASWLHLSCCHSLHHIVGCAVAQGISLVVAWRASSWPLFTASVALVPAATWWSQPHQYLS